MNVIFLDIDGVLNCSGSKSKMIDGDSSYVGIDKHKILRLKEIINRTDAKIVLTSTWRIHLYKNDRVDKYMRQRFKKYGVEIYSCADYKRYSRGTGIKNWLKDHPDVEGWAVLDDEIFVDYDKDIRQHLLLTEFYSDQGGLRDEDIDIVCDIINGKLQEAGEVDITKTEEFVHVGLSDYVE